MAENVKANKTEIMNIIITLVLMFGIGFLPTVSELTASGMKILGILLGVIYGCSFCKPAWPCLMGMVALVITGVSSAPVVLGAGIGNDSIWLMTFFFVFVAVLQEAGVTEVMAKWIISLKITKGKPWVFTYILMLGTLLIGAMGLSFPAMIIFWTILMTTCQEFGIKPFTPYPTVAFVGIALAGLASSSLWTFMGNPLFVNAMLGNISGGQYGFNVGSYALFSAVLWIVILLVYILLFKFVLRIDASPLKAMDAAKTNGGAGLDNRQKAMLLYSVLVLVIYCGIGFVPSTTPFGAWLDGFGSSFPLIMILGLMCVTYVGGEPLCDFGKAASKGVVWDTVILSGALLAIATIMMTTNTGVPETILAVLNPIFAGHGTIFMTIIICVVSVILTNFMANTTVGLMFCPVIYSFSQSMGFNPMPMMALMLISITVAYMTPAASPYASLLFGYSSEWVKKGDLYKYGLISCIVIVITLLVVGIPLSRLIF